MGLVEFPVIVNDEPLTLILEEEEALRASKDEAFLVQLIRTTTQQTTILKNINYMKDSDEHVKKEIEDCDIKNITDIDDYNEEGTENQDPNNMKISDEREKIFSWPEKAIFLLIELYREKDEEFSSGLKRHNILWKEIARSMNETNKHYNLTGQQCSNKWSGLKRTYRNIVDQNNKSGNSRNSWAFFSIMESMLGNKVSTKPISEASSDGPQVQMPLTSKATSPFTSRLSLSESQEVKSPPKKRKVEAILEGYIAEIRKEREIAKTERLAEIKRYEERREERHKQRTAERAKIHEEKMKMQQSLINILEKLTNN